MQDQSTRNTKSPPREQTICVRFGDLAGVQERESIADRLDLVRMIRETAERPPGRSRKSGPLE
jgi:hypothetical protein